MDEKLVETVARAIGSKIYSCSPREQEEAARAAIDAVRGYDEDGVRKNDEAMAPVRERESQQ